MNHKKCQACNMPYDHNRVCGCGRQVVVSIQKIGLHPGSAADHIYMGQGKFQDMDFDFTLTAPGLNGANLAVRLEVVEIEVEEDSE